MKYNTPSRYKGKWFNNSLACIKISRYRKSPRTTIRKVGKLLFISGAKPGKNTSCLIYVTRTNVGGGAWYRPITSVSLLWYFLSHSLGLQIIDPLINVAEWLFYPSRQHLLRYYYVLLNSGALDSICPSLSLATALHVSRDWLLFPITHPLAAIH